MIILEDPFESQHPPKFADDDARSVHRPATPTPSLPSYESSQAFTFTAAPNPDPEILNPPPEEKPYRTWLPKQANARLRRIALYALVVYFVLTVGVGVPIIVTQLRRRAFSHPSFSSSGSTSSSSLIAAGSQTLLESSAVGCNAWTEETSTQASLTYDVPLSDLVFLHSNISYTSDATTLQDISGSLLVGINADPSIHSAVASVSMQYSNITLKDQTSVCLMNVSNSSGIYFYVPSNLAVNDSLIFNVTFLLPQAQSAYYIPEFVTMLPHFEQWYTQLSGYVSFDRASLGGPRSKVTVGSIDANSLAVKTALAEIEGNFNVTESLVLETVSAPINANISLYNSGTLPHPIMLDVSTGNAALNACVSLYRPPLTSTQPPRMPDFMTRFETFNAPLAVVVNHEADSADGFLEMRAESSVGQVMVSVDNKYSGTFDVMTTFEEAKLYLTSVDSISELMETLSQVDMSLYREASTTTSSSAPERTVSLDTVETSRVSGWVGTPGTRLSVPPRKWNGQGVIEVMSTLSPVALLLGT